MRVIIVFSLKSHPFKETTLYSNSLPNCTKCNPTESNSCGLEVTEGKRVSVMDYIRLC